MNPHEPVPADRLCDAVDAVLRGLSELGGHPLASSPAKLMGHGDQPEALCDFTLTEVQAAERFLVRCGMLGDAPGSQP